MPQLNRNEGIEILAIIDVSSHPKSSLDPNLVSLQDLGERYGSKLFASVEDMINDSTVGPEIDGIIVATPHATHSYVGGSVLNEATRRYQAGMKPLHILMEKPMTTDVEEAKQLYDVSC